ncbi:MAG: carboxylesterase type B [Alphaproteobacteria bacterium]
MAEIGFVFDTTNLTFHGYADRVRALITEIQGCWSHFAHTGRPTQTCQAWPNYGKEHNYLYFGHEKTILTKFEHATVTSWSMVSDQQLASF